MSAARSVRAPALVATLFVGCAALLAGCASAPRTSEDGVNEQEAARLNVRLGVAYLQQGNLEIAKEKLERALKQNPQDPDVHAALALLYERLGRPDQVDSHFRTALRLAPRDPQIANNYAVYLCKSGRYEEGVMRLERAARNALYRTPEAAYTNAGVCLRKAGRSEDAEQYFRRALEKRPSYAEAAVQLGDMYLEQGRSAEARARIDQYFGAFPATPDLLLLAVRVSRSLGDRLAEQRYARRLRLDFPESDAARALAELSRNPG